MKELAEKSDLHLKRKLWHVLTGLGAVMITVLLHFDSFQAALAAFAIGFSGLVFELVRLKNKRLNDYFVGLASGVLRKREATQISGFTYYCFGVSFTFYFFPFEVAMLAVFFLIFSDPIAALVGTRYGKRTLIKGKSLEGSLACFITCFFISCFATYVTDYGVGLIPLAMLGGISGMVAEMITFIDDNLTLPVVSGLLLSQGLQLLV